MNIFLNHRYKIADFTWINLVEQISN